MIQIGSRVKYIHENTKADKELGYYPPVGTHGTVTNVSKFKIKVHWDSGTKDGDWWCPIFDVEEVNKEFYSDLHMEQIEQM